MYQTSCNPKEKWQYISLSHNATQYKLYKKLQQYNKKKQSAKLTNHVKEVMHKDIQ